MAMKILSNRWAFEFEEMIELPDKLDFGGIILWPEELLVGNEITPFFLRDMNFNIIFLSFSR